MDLALQVVSSHLLGVRDIEQALSVQEALGEALLPHAASEAETLKRPNCPRLFLLDGCSLHLALGPISSRLRANSPGSKFLALLPPHRSGESEMMALFHWGIDGFVTLHEGWRAELPLATMALLRDRLWVPSEVQLAFIMRMKALLDRQLLGHQSLTARETQVLHLLFRHLTNKEIAHQLNIRERTAKFHVSNLLRKLGLENRRHLGSLDLCAKSVR
jgi:DNA-binding CsgD family transcriptional regulator